jgi:hypothetical protein
MTTVNDIFNVAINRDAVSLKSAIDDIMTTKVAYAVDQMFPDVAASLFGTTDGEVEDSEEQEFLDTDEEQPDEHV